ncbi:MAG TPA: hypothetical protein VFE53_01760 [Mucilaginibacter sp.]|jgi:hypothetical protein|nr:hypothetical protein [Mucilaginibacter sp.]
MGFGINRLTHRQGISDCWRQTNNGGEDPLLYDRYDEYVQQKIGNAVQATKANVLIIDNITCMGSTTQHAGRALPLCF